jgi:hypothetical protein
MRGSQRAAVAKELATATGLPVDGLDHPDFEEAAANAVRLLISPTRDSSRYPLVFTKNKSNGSLLTCLGIRPVGIYASGVALGGIPFSRRSVLGMTGYRTSEPCLER